MKCEPWSKLKAKEKRETLASPGGYTRSCSVSKHSSIFIVNHFGEKFSEEENEILKRFGKVFEQSYTRFLDLQTAEAQAREAQIEAAVERVRAQSMAMHQTTDINNVTLELLNQLNQLKVDGLTGTSIYMVDANDIVTVWDISSPGSISDPSSYAFSYDAKKYPLLGGWAKTFKTSKQDYFVLDFPKAILLKAVGEFKKILPEMAVHLKTAIDSGKLTHQWNPVARLSNGVLAIDLTIPPTDDTKNIVTKMAGAFNQAYTRFLDLQKAEAQTRESEIELALERVRARTMAMRKSEELKEVIQEVYDQFIQLKINIEHTGFILDYKEREDMLIWLADKHGVPSPQIRIPYFDSPHWNSFVEAKKKDIHFFTNQLDFKAKNKFYRQLFKLIPGIPKEAIDFYLTCPALAISTVLLDNVGLYIENFEGIPYTDEENNILLRFGNVFQQTYTRFLDLQKAEAQVKEAQIEAALERVRSRTMAMQKSEELREVILLLLKTLPDLGISMKNRATGIFTYEEGNKDYYQWAASPEYNSIISFHTPYIDHPVQNDIWNARRNGTDFYAKSYTVQEKNSLFKFFFELPALKNMPLKDKKRALGFKYYDIAIAFEQNSAIVLVSHSGIPLTEDENEILKRFSKVFEQTYTRFLDLQKAEAQTREAQIEAALERTRSQSMLMQKSKELDATSRVFHEQLQQLGIDTAFSYVWLPDEEHHEHKFWVAWDEKEKTKSDAIIYPLDKSEPYTAACFKDWESGNKVYIHHVPSKDVKIFFSAWKELLSGARHLKPSFFADGLYYAEAFMKYGCFGINIKRKITKEEQQILQRFSVEFERTYTRFLDLQKAEAQARESEIELALERVRARTMAMQHSDELAEASFLLDSQVESIGY